MYHYQLYQISANSLSLATILAKATRVIQLMTLKDASSLKTFSLRMPLLPRFQLQCLDPVQQLVELSLPLPRPKPALSWKQLAQHHQQLLSTHLQQLVELPEEVRQPFRSTFLTPLTCDSQRSNLHRHSRRPRTTSRVLSR